MPDALKLVTIVIPSGYQDAAEFLKDCGFQGASDIERIAATCHQANKALCAAFGDLSQVDWNEAPQWQRDSAIAGVKFCTENPTAPPSANHDSWLEEKRRTGWRYGLVKDADAKTHPCFVPYDELPPDQKAKDYVFKAIVGALA